MSKVCLPLYIEKVYEAGDAYGGSRSQVRQEQYVMTNGTET